MRPASQLIYNNFNTYEWLDYHLSTDFNGGNEAIGIQKPALSEFFSASNLNLSKSNINRSANLNLSKSNVSGSAKPNPANPKHPIKLNPSRSNVDMSGDDFDNVAGKGKLCKGAGLSGAEKRACKKNIKSTCGRKPMFGRAKKEKWSTCANANVVTPEQSAQETADKLVPTREDSGLSTGAKVAIAFGAVGFLALVGLAIHNNRKANKAMMMKQPVIART